ncbi:MAG: hypothetical protein A3E23_06300 [Burkholderiales bacterium RIFCSPHIGHO2_12_FULL_65_48]|jgi:hypothetical protein|nr:MAG: hypothetical protein A3C40_07815 [Burkholderiales bacterium RIFCSPHIGHO2_02_FULL_64_19]OGB24230.1 MAG: hypothetical protein A3E23_06300 [Burkholderiales bacterium RIFCSPHIGHO2_12_FULL_65_48]OGB52098.1 MAG: hypothetical protein A3F71_08080 [Burkholderiales bacterium RIFCSPLOWO2_12_FULL_64_33]
MKNPRWLAVSATLALAATVAHADTGKLLLTGGVSTIAGSAGGGLTPWAVIGSNATEGEVGFSGYATRAATQDYGLNGYGVAVGLHDRVELSLARQDFDASPAIALNGIAPFGVTPGQHIQMDIVGIKVKVAGDAVLNADSWMPQIAVGLEHKRVRPGSIGSVLDFLGTQTSGTDVYVSATKLLLAQSLLVNGTLRSTNANQNGLLGFGAAAPGKNRRSLQPEFSVAYLISKNLAVGAEVRFKPNNLQALGAAAGLGAALREDDWKDIFIAWAPSKNLSLTLAYVDLGRIVPGITNHRRQTGYYLSAQVAF